MSELNLLSDNPQEIESSIINAYNALRVESGEKEITPANPIYIFLKSIAYVLSCYSALINEKLMQNFIDYASGEYLDALGKLTGTIRLQATKSLCTVRFTRVAGTSNAVLIPKGTRVTADSVIYFGTKENAEIVAGADTVQVIVEAVDAGSAANGYGIDSINQIVDNIAYLKSVENITESTGGTDIESDESYKERIFLAPETFSVAGPKLAYVYHTKSVSSEIIDVAVVSDEPGVVKIYPLLSGGTMPGEELLQSISNKLSASDVRPLTDKVEVLEPVRKEYNIDLDYYLYEERDAIPDEKVQKVVNDYVMWQKSVLGRDINPDKLIADLQVLGIKRVVIREPVFTKVESNELALCVSASASFKGLEIE